MTVIQGLAKGDKLDFVVQKATELGAARIIPVTTARAVARLDAGAIRTMSRRARWQKIAREASRQSGRLDVPEVEGVAALSTAVAASPKDALKLMLWEGARQTSLRSHLPAEPPQQIVIAVGPEGGFTVEEVEAARERGLHRRRAGAAHPAHRDGGAGGPFDFGLRARRSRLIIWHPWPRPYSRRSRRCACAWPDSGGGSPRASSICWC